jgi:hypothetical protein
MWQECGAVEIVLDRSDGFAHIPDDAVVAVKRLLNAVQDRLPTSALRLALPLHLRTLGRFRREAQQVAKLVDADPALILIANLIYDFVVMQMGCSTIALPTPDGPVLARNMDFAPQDLLAQSSRLIRFRRRDTVQFTQAGWPGAIGTVSALSPRGFAVVLNAVASKEGLNRLGYPVLLHLRRVVEQADDFDQALHWLSEAKLMMSAIFTLVGTENQQRVVIERTPTRHQLRWPVADEPLVTTNDFRALAKFQAERTIGPLASTSCRRFDSLCGFFADHRSDQTVDDAHLLYALTDPSVIQEITAQHMIFRPRQQTVRLFVPTRLMP